MINYTEKVKQHFLNPKNFLAENEKFEADATGEIGNAACGDIMQMFLKIQNGTITECKWRTYGCASAIAATSVLSELAKGLTLEQAEKLNAQDIIKELGQLPPKKIHCSLLADRALKKAIEKYKNNLK